MVKAALLVAASLPLLAQVGRDWGVERQSYVDPISKLTVWNITSPDRGEAQNLYYHFSNFTKDNRYLIFFSNRTGTAQIYRYDVESGHIVQLTDAEGTSAASACPDNIDPKRLYFMRGPDVMSINIETFKETRIGSIPEPRAGGYQQPTLTRDGKLLTVTKQRDKANWEVGMMSVATGEYRTVTIQGFRIGHVQHHPTEPTIFYVWETGGYAPQRSWIVNEDGTGNRPFYARTDPKTWFTPMKEWMTHEAWIPGTGEMTMIMDKVGALIVDKDGNASMLREGNWWHACGRDDGQKMLLDDFNGKLYYVDRASGSTRLLASGLRDKDRGVHAHASFDHKGRYAMFNSARTHKGIAIVDLKQLGE